jgi:hypothetical protein
VTIGDYLRALVTADADLFPEDERSYRLAVVESFRQMGLGPARSGTLSPLQLLWSPPQGAIDLGQVLHHEPVPASSRKEEFEAEGHRRARLYASWLSGSEAALTAETARQLGLALDANAPRTIARSNNQQPRVEVRSFRLARRIAAGGEIVADWVVTVTQRRRGYFDPAVQQAQDGGEKEKTADFTFRGGCTLLIDAATGGVRFCIAKDILAHDRLARHRESAQQGVTPLASPGEREDPEPFLTLRRATAGSALGR